jgi:processive 1,2-diacylglycerol beta-glucosyltransferase
MIKLYDLQSGDLVGELTEEQFGFLASELEEESSEDQDYYLNQATVDMLEADGADPGLIAVLRQALGAKEDMDIRWVRE